MKWFMACLLLIFFVSSSAFTLDTDVDWAEMAQLVEQAEQIIQQQSIQLNEAKQQLVELNSQLIQQSREMQGLQKSYRRCVKLSIGIGTALATMLIVELYRN